MKAAVNVRGRFNLRHAIKITHATGIGGARVAHLNKAICPLEQQSTYTSTSPAKVPKVERKQFLFVSGSRQPNLHSLKPLYHVVVLVLLAYFFCKLINLFTCECSFIVVRFDASIANGDNAPFQGTAVYGCANVL